jgi:hypothetical protein
VRLLFQLTADKYRIKTSISFNLNNNIPGHLLQMEGREIIKPKEKAFYPGNEFLEHHRNRFVKAR